MKSIIKTSLLLGLISVFCTSCKAYRSGVYDSNPKYLFQVLECSENASLYKVTFKNLDKNIYKYKPNTIDINNDFGFVTDTEHGIINYNDRFVYCESEVEMVLTSKNKNYRNNLKTYILLDDTCYGNMFGSLSKKYIRVNRLNEFLTSYDYFYVNVSKVNSFYNTNREIYYRNKKTNINEGILISPKGFQMFPVKEGKIKLDELVKFHKNNYEIGYDYKNIEDYVSDGEAKRYFVDYFHNDMGEEELLSSFSALFDNPPNKYYIP